MTLARLMVLGALVGAVVGYLFRAQSDLAPYQSRVRWVPALLVGRDVRGLVRLAAWTLGLAAIGAGFGWVVHATLDAMF